MSSRVDILLTGFKPFGELSVNPSEQVVRELCQRRFTGATLHTRVLPVKAKEVASLLPELLYSIRPCAVLCLGAAPRDTVTVERLAINLLDFDDPDEAGEKITDQLVVNDGPVAYWATAPTKEFVAAIKQQNIDCLLSLPTDGFICNQVMYLALHWAAEHSPATRVGFLHLPLPAELTKGLSCKHAITLEDQVNAVAACLRIIIRRNGR